MRNKSYVHKIQQIEYHRNGVMGTGFSIVKFSGGNLNKLNMLGVVFPDKGNVAVFNLDELARGNINFGENSWRGDEFEHELRLAIQ